MPCLSSAAGICLGEVVTASACGRHASASRPHATEVELALDGGIVGGELEGGVLHQQVADLVAGSAGSIRYAGDRRVEREPAQLDAAVEQAADQRLDVVAADRRGCRRARRRRRRRRGARRGSTPRPPASRRRRWRGRAAPTPGLAAHRRRRRMRQRGQQRGRRRRRLAQSVTSAASASLVPDGRDRGPGC